MSEIRERARLAYDRTLAQKNLRERMAARMVLAHAGGLWNCDAQLLSILSSYIDHDEIALLDANDIPRKINPKSMICLVQQRHQEIMNEWLVEYAKLSSIRTAKDV